MAENKKSFLLYADTIHVIEKLTDEQAGKLLKHLFRYVNDKNPVAPDLLTEISFEPIKQQLKRDLVKWESELDRFSRAGKASAAKRALSKSEKQSTEVNNVEQRSTKSTVNVTVNDTVTVNVNDDDDFNAGHQQFGIKLFSENGSEDLRAIEEYLRMRISTETINQFNVFLKTETKQHYHYSEYIKHLRNWLNKRPKDTKKPKKLERF